MKRTIQNLNYRIQGLVSIVGLVFFISCSSKHNLVQLPFGGPEEFSDSGIAELADNWWKSFGDSNLNQIVDSALLQNLHLFAVWNRFNAADAAVKRERGGYYPQVEASGAGILSSGADGDSENNLQLGFNASYEIDLWGRIRSQVQAEQYRAQASYMDYQTAALSLSAEIALTYFQLQEAKSEVTLIHQQIETNEKALRLIRARFVGGQVRGVDMLRQNQLLEATREQLINAEIKVGVIQHKLAVLLGKPANELHWITENSLPELPQMPATGLPLELVKRRPDVQSSYNQLLAADRDLATAISNRFPRLTLSASLNTSANSVDNLFNDWAYTLAGNLLAPLFYGARLKAEQNRNEYIKEQRLYEYGQAILNAFREVEDALLREKKQTEKMQSIKTQLELTQKSYQRLMEEYLNGMSGYLDVLTAIELEQELQRRLLTEKYQLIAYRIDLYRALGGSINSPMTNHELQY